MSTTRRSKASVVLRVSPRNDPCSPLDPSAEAFPLFVFWEVVGWAVVYRYTLLVGKPPFETSSLRETYGRIQRNEYRVPCGLSAPARDLIHRLLHPDPQRRPSMEDVLRDEFLLSGTCATCMSRFVGFESKLEQFGFLLNDFSPKVLLETFREEPNVKIGRFNKNREQ